MRVRRHDLARLLLEFRANLERDGDPGGWEHMRDYDQSFERLADAVDAANVAASGVNSAPDLRMRCNLTDPVYAWPDSAPYNCQPVDAVKVKGNGPHYVPRADRQSPRALCGFRFEPEEGERITRAPDCLECVREYKLDPVLRQYGLEAALREMELAIKEGRAHRDA